MPTPLKLNVFFGFPSYGGNGGISSEVPCIRQWFCETLLKAKDDTRIDKIVEKTIADTPITMVRNRFVNLAREAGCDVLVMVDSDQSPNKHKGEPGWKPFWDTSFDFLYQRYNEGPIAICAPYCGPPPHPNIYVFQWGTPMDGLGEETQMSLDQYSREEASQMTGIQEIAAAPTGLIMYDLRCFDLIDPPYFKYEWKDETASEKASTEDVQNTRDISMCGQIKLGYNPLFCNWDSWIGHWKPWNVGKPNRLSSDHVCESFQRAVLAGNKSDERTFDPFAYQSPRLKALIETAHPVRANGDGERENTSADVQ